MFAYALYRSTLLPGVDFGDTGSFQTTVGSRLLTPRVGYPLYFAIGGAFLRLTGMPPAHALNLVTAIEGALACAMFVVVAAEISGSIAIALAAAVLFATSYTFWSQCVIAEVYALHLLLMLASIWLLLRWERRPTSARLAAFFLCYAIAFGNHLAMILLLPAFAIFLLRSAPGGWRTMLTARAAASAAVCAAIGALQYAWNVRTLWFQLTPPDSIVSALRTFWFDVTKSDWRDTMVLEVPRSLLADHAAMYWFDLRQQFGFAVPLLAVFGLAAVARSQVNRAVLLAVAYLVCVAFAFSYNVGDSHVFYLPSHLIVALLTACGAAAIGRRGRHGTAAAAVALAAYAGVRGYRDYPAIDRSGDTRPTTVLSAMTRDLNDRDAIFLVDLNWQVANGLSYFTRSVRPEIATARMRDVLLYAPALLADNLDQGRRVALDASAARILDDSYGPLFRPAIDISPPAFTEIVRRVPAGSRYVVCILKPSRDMALDAAGLAAALRVLSGGAAVDRRPGDYAVIAGIAGRPPSVVRAADRPFRERATLDGVTADIRMESWLTSDTIRRMGFGHVIVGRRHTLIVERGISFAAFDAAGEPITTAYFSGIFALPARYLIR